MIVGQPTPPRPVGMLTTNGKRVSRRRDRGFPYGVGDRIAGDLLVIGHLAAGRLGHLYQVWSTGEWTALTCKILAPELRDNARAMAALRREARILRRLRHPSLIRGFGGGMHDGLPFVLLEYVEGPSLFDLIEARPRRRFAVADAVRIAIHAAAGLHHLHRNGWLHLDLKPANLLFRDGRPVIVDFDAARAIRPRRRPRDSLGTAPYMAPEQVRQQPLSPAADVYGLGAVLYEMLTGRWPYEAVFNGDETRTGDERSYPQLGAEPAPPPRRFNRAIPSSLEQIVLRCLDPNPDRRFPTMHHVLLALATELAEPASLWPHGVRAERRTEPRT